MHSNKFIGIDLGGTKCAVVLGRKQADPVILEKRQFATADYPDPRTCTQKMFQEIENLLSRHNGELAGIGISCGGPLDSKKGIIQSPPNLPNWVDYLIVERFHSRYGVPVVLENDANACAVAEWKYGAGQGCRDIIFLTCGTGLGAGMILDGKLYRGANGMAGEVGHIRLENFGPVGYGKSGSVEGFCSGGGLAQLGRTFALQALQQGKTVRFCSDLADLNNITAQSIAQAAEQQDPIAQQVYHIFARQLGRTLSILVDLLNPQRIIIGSIYQRNEEMLAKQVYSVMEKECLPASLSCCQVVGSGLGDAIGDYAALSLIMD